MTPTEVVLIPRLLALHEQVKSEAVNDHGHQPHKVLKWGEWVSKYCGDIAAAEDLVKNITEGGRYCAGNNELHEPADLNSSLVTFCEEEEQHAFTGCGREDDERCGQHQ